MVLSALNPTMSNGTEGHVIARKQPQQLGHVGQCLLSGLFERLRDRITIERGMKHAVGDQSLVKQPERAELRGGARCFGDGGFLGPCNQDDRGHAGIGQGRKRCLETLFAAS